MRDSMTDHDPIYLAYDLVQRSAAERYLEELAGVLVLILLAGGLPILGAAIGALI